MKHHLFPYLCLSLSAMAFSFTGPILRLAAEAGADYWPTICLRCAVNTTALIIISRRLPRFRRKNVFGALLLNAQFLLFAKAVQMVNPGTATVLTYTSLLWVPAISFLYAKQKVSFLDIVTSVALLFSCAVCFADQLSFQEHLGMLFALGTGFLWSLGLVVTARQSAQSEDAGLDTFVLTGFMLLLVSGSAWIGAGSSMPESSGMLWALLGGVQSTVALGLFSVPLKTLESTKVNIGLSTFDPILASTWSWLIFHKKPAPWALVGGCCIILTLFLHGALAILGRRRRLSANEKFSPEFSNTPSAFEQ